MINAAVKNEAVYISDELEFTTAFADSLEDSDPMIAMDSSRLKKFSCSIKNGRARHRIASNIEAIKSRDISISEDASEAGMSGGALLLEENDLVGIEKPKNEVIEKFLASKSAHEVVSVVGESISGVLATKEKSRIDEWKMVHRSLGVGLEDNDRLKNAGKILSLTEGFLKEKEGLTLEEVAEDYLNELIKQVLYSVSRSLSFILSSGHLSMLNILDLEGASLREFPQVVTLVLSKYPSLRNPKVNSIPSFINKLQNLETLDRKHAHVTALPVEIMMLQKLRHLLVYHYEIESGDQTRTKYGFKVPARNRMITVLTKVLLLRGKSEKYFL
ncbi:unnamed protein product [Dovyalis caffra]|uniref:Uncharacterized protein n=1 Tax=Dovyalis caffra TaxID=77055 RepID=A0AAV1SQI3_9ROSI|nr:unnamed protein product [Dovyalis caffra]